MIADVVRMVSWETAAENSDAPTHVLLAAAHLHKRLGELLSAEQYEDIIREREATGDPV